MKLFFYSYQILILKTLKILFLSEIVKNLLSLEFLTSALMTEQTNVDFDFDFKIFLFLLFPLYFLGHS